MKLKKYSEGFIHYCPGCKEMHCIPTEPHAKLQWSFNGNENSATFSPSVRNTTPEYKDEDCIVQATCCHYFIRGGQIEFCGDSTHELAGKTVELPDIPTPVSAP